MTLPDPKNPLILMVGAQGSGKSTLVGHLFAAGDRFSLDGFRTLLAGDPAALDATPAATQMLRAAVHYRMFTGRTTVVDATHAVAAYRDVLRHIAMRYQRPTVVIRMHTPLEVCLDRQVGRFAPYPGANFRTVPEHVVRRDWKAIQDDPPAAADYDVVVHMHPTDAGRSIAETRHPHDWAQQVLAPFLAYVPIVPAGEPLPWLAPAPVMEGATDA